MAVRDVLKLGNPRLHDRSLEVQQSELASLSAVVTDLHDTLMDFRARHQAGRAVSAPQIGVMKRLIYMNVGEPVALINPHFTFVSPEMMEVWDDCMSFPDLLVRVLRHERCQVRFHDERWRQRSLDLEGDLAELLQHEVDHLDGVLAVARAIDGQSFALKSERELKRNFVAPRQSLLSGD